MFLGAVSKAGLKRVVDYCDGWLLVDPQDGALERAVPELDALCAEAGRDRASISLTVFATSPLDNALLEAYASAGVDRVVSFLAPESPAAALAVMDASAKFIGRF